MQISEHIHTRPLKQNNDWRTRLVEEWVFIPWNREGVGEALDKHTRTHTSVWTHRPS